jgi:hypothetical protein
MSDHFLPHGDITQKIIGCFYEVHDELGHGFSETVLRRSMMVALRQKGMQTAEHVALEVRFRGVPVGSFFADLGSRRLCSSRSRRRPRSSRTPCRSF